MIIQPTLRVRPATQRTGRTYLTIGVKLPDGHVPVSTFRSQNVGVGGTHTFCKIAPGEPVRRATQAELRKLDRIHIIELLTEYPDGQIVVSRSWH